MTREDDHTDMDHRPSGPAEWLLWLAASHLPLIRRRECARDRDQQLQTGLAMVVLGVVSFFSGGFFFYDAFQWWPAFILGGFLWPLALIIGIDRTLLVSLREGQSQGAIALRFAVALNVAVLISEPINHHVFRAEIAAEMREENIERTNDARVRIGGGYRAELVTLQSEQDQLESELSEKETKRDEQRAAASGEADGIAGTMIEGFGEHFEYKDSLGDVLDRELSELRTRHSPRLAQIQARRGEIDRELQRQLAEYEAGLEEDDGPLRQARILWKLTLRNPGVFLLSWALRLLLVLLEIAPLYARVSARRGVYDSRLDEFEESRVSEIDSQRVNKLEAAKVRDQVLHQIRETFKAMVGQKLSRVADGDHAAEGQERFAEQVAERFGSLAFEAFRDPLENGGRTQQSHERDSWQPSWRYSDPPARAGNGHLFSIVPTDEGDLGGSPSKEHRGAVSPRISWRRRMASFLWRTRGRRTVTVAIGVPAGSIVLLGLATSPWWLRPCANGPCEIEAWIEQERAQTAILDRTGEVLWTYPGIAHVGLDSVPPYVIQVLKEIEDARFDWHPGIDPVATMRALGQYVVPGGPTRGASTITMQAVRCLDRRGEIRPDRTLPGKVAEMRLAFDLEAQLSKPEVLALYIGCVTQGHVSGDTLRGLGEGALVYFGKPLSEVSLAEAAMLIGIIQRPEYFDPFRFPQRTLQRRNFVLGRFAEEYPGYRDEAERALREPLGTVPEAKIPVVSTAFRMVAGRLGRESLPDTLRTTFEASVQRTAEGVVWSLLRDIEADRYVPYAVDPDNRLGAGMVAMDRATGDVIAYVCGRPRDASARWDLCRYGQISFNSTLKIWLLLACLDAGVVEMTDTLADLEARAGFPHQSNAQVARVREKSGGRLGWSLEEAFVQSDNYAATLLFDLLPQEGFDQLRLIGINLDAGQPAQALGTATMNPIDMARLVAGIANGGPIPKARIVEESSLGGSSIPDRLPFKASSLEIVRDLLQAVVERGTAVGAREELSPGTVGYGKTGTSSGNQGNEELLLVGYSEPRGTVVLLWVGHLGARRQIHERAMAGPILARYWGRLLAAASESGEGASEN